MPFQAHRRVRWDQHSHYVIYRNYIYRPVIVPWANGVFNRLEKIVDNDETKFGPGDMVSIFPYLGLPIISIIGRKGAYQYEGRELWSLSYV